MSFELLADEGRSLIMYRMLLPLIHFFSKTNDSWHLIWKAREKKYTLKIQTNTAGEYLYNVDKSEIQKFIFLQLII